MKKAFLMFLLLAMVGCGKNQTVTTPDHKKQIDDNTARIAALEKAVSEIQADQEATEQLLQDEVARLDQADEDNLEYLENKLNSQSNRLVSLIYRGDRRLGYQIAMLRRSLYQAVRSHRSDMRDLYNELEELEDSVDEAINELKEADEELLAKIKKNRKKNRELSKDLARFKAYQAGRDRGQDILARGNFMYLYNRFSAQIRNIYSSLRRTNGSIFVLEQAVAALETAVSIIETDLSDLEATVGDIDVDLSALEGDIEDLGDDLSGVQEQANENSDDIEDLESAIARLGQSSGCSIYYSNVHSHGWGRLYADINVKCQAGSYRLRSHAGLSGGAR